METSHRILFGDARKADLPPEEQVDLVITSPPYPMIEMWDGVFSDMNPEIAGELASLRGDSAFGLMHAELDRVWERFFEKLRPGGFLCINIGDAARRIGSSFKLYPNHARIMEFMRSLGAQALPVILWNKTTNAPNKFMGSGMLPAGAYVTLEHEYILIFRKGGKRVFKEEQEKLQRRRSAFFWEERNTWFSDRWTLPGERQALRGDKNRKRSGAFPFELAYRLILMYSLEGETVTDPFLGTGTTMFAAMATGRNSLGSEIDPAMKPVIAAGLEKLRDYGKDVNHSRLKDHIEFIEKYNQRAKPAKHYNGYYGFPVVTSQEKDIQLPVMKGVRKTEDSFFRVTYENVSRETLL